MKLLLVPAAVALLSGSVIVLVGGAGGEVLLLATIVAGAFADLARRTLREPPPSRPDFTDHASSIAFFAVLVAAAFDLGAADSGLEEVWSARVLGGSVVALGVWLRTRAVRALGENFHMRLAITRDHSLVDGGPYRWIRHPNYAALLIVACGIALALKSPLALGVAAGLWLPVILLRIEHEERQLLERFDARYREYMGRTWRLIVGIY